MMVRIVQSASALAMLLLVLGCKTSSTDLERNLRSKVAEGAGTTFRMQDLTPFAWERLYVFAPYSPAEEINERLGFRWSGARESGIESSDSINLLVFVNDGRVVHSLAYRRGEGDFVESRSEGYGPREARFVVADEWKWERRVVIKPAI